MRINHFNQQEQLQAYLCFTGLCFIALQLLGFLQIEGLRQPYIYQRRFSNSTGSPRVSVSQFGNSRGISNLFVLLYLLQRSVVSDL